MKINWMRFIDYRVGRPVCTLLSLYSWAKGLFLRPVPSAGESPDSVLFIKLFGIGSVILSYPAVETFKRTYPKSEVFYLTFASNKEILEILSMAEPDNIITIRDDSILHILSDAIKALKLVKRKGIRTTVDFEFFSRFTAIFAFLSGAEKRVGFYNYHTEGLSRGKVINVPVSYNHTKHTSEVFSHLAQAIGAPECEVELPSVVIDDYTLPQGLEAFKKIIVLNVNSSELIRLRAWPLENFSRLADLILKEFKDAAIVFTGTKKERLAAEEAAAGITESEGAARVFDLSGKTSVKDFLGLINNSLAVVTIDSGTAHIASLTDTLVIDLFGPETPALYSPLSERAVNIYLDLPCQPCVSVFNGKLSHCTDNICLKQITPEAVMKVLSSELSPEFS